jgi:ubiquinone/menaquinone biosynthesis C-methylase UbiE
MSSAVDTDETSTTTTTQVTNSQKMSSPGSNYTDPSTTTVSPMMDVESQMQPVEQDDRSPAERENDKFFCDESVEFWRNFQINGFDSAEQNLQKFAQLASRFAQNPDSLDYFVRHGGRTGYFVANAILGSLGFRLHDLLVNRKNSESAFESIIREPSVTSRILLECAYAYEQDWNRIQEGKYNKPYDMYERTRQSSPLYFGQQTARFVREAIGTLGRRGRGGEEDKKVWLFGNDEGAASSLYPDYYQNAFHYQTDGWMSQVSADVYETSTETLFLGRQDAMQRTSLPPLVEYSKKITGRPMKVLEIAAGTGRFMTFARDSLPLDTQYTVSDLSPFYLSAARDNDSNWRRVRSRVERNKGNRNVPIRPARFLQAKAEDLPFQNEEFDAVVCVYLFHEIPREIRAQVAAEMARVVKPGGSVVLTDSVQLGDRPIFDATIGNFQNMNEPHYQDFIRDDLPLHFENSGLECRTKMVCTSTKSLSFAKPGSSSAS